ncbi:MAG: hypothetical protein PQ612_09630 [Rickettsiales bacterium]|nr:hypothetical protein [Pseudomonadota bacterium]MDA0966054.1 hypothetical protein [Pseudomonadota bacterium]MDG4544236.1 hypothetical protein [Rickettsiales bacterium]MDG4546415.1 hypothetical protein [Rickettsiales bacterium]MDG4548560.1 hypothetical protein [Rickettsiales bacterium]
MSKKNSKINPYLNLIIFWLGALIFPSWLYWNVLYYCVESESLRYSIIVWMSIMEPFTNFFYELIPAIGTYAYQFAQVNGLPKSMVFIHLYGMIWFFYAILVVFLLWYFRDRLKIYIYRSLHRGYKLTFKLFLKSYTFFTFFLFFSILSWHITILGFENMGYVNLGRLELMIPVKICLVFMSIILLTDQSLKLINIHWRLTNNILKGKRYV